MLVERIFECTYRNDGERFLRGEAQNLDALGEETDVLVRDLIVGVSVEDDLTSRRGRTVDPANRAAR